MPPQQNENSGAPTSWVSGMYASGFRASTTSASMPEVACSRWRDSSSSQQRYQELEEQLEQNGCSRQYYWQQRLWQRQQQQRQQQEDA